LWGIQPERLSASLYFIGYSLAGSFPLLFNIINTGTIKNTLTGEMRLAQGYFFKEVFFIKFSHILILVFWYFAFFLKMPVLGFHIWLPKAHVEAPVFGSVILAAILLKLGSYGIVRVNLIDETIPTIFLVCSF